MFHSGMEYGWVALQSGAGDWAILVGALVLAVVAIVTVVRTGWSRSAECPECGHELETGGKRCPSCGADASSGEVYYHWREG